MLTTKEHVKAARFSLVWSRVFLRSTWQAVFIWQDNNFRLASRQETREKWEGLKANFVRIFWNHAQAPRVRIWPVNLCWVKLEDILSLSCYFHARFLTLIIGRFSFKINLRRGWLAHCSNKSIEESPLQTRFQSSSHFFQDGGQQTSDGSGYGGICIE